MDMKQQFIKVASRFLLLLAVFAAFAVSAFAAEFVVVANKSVPVNSLSKSELQSIFLGEKTKWDDGKPIKLYVMGEGSAHRSFLESIVEKSSSQFEIYWKKLVFTGKAAAPKVINDSGDLVATVARQVGAISYTTADQSRTAVKTISVK